LEQQIHPVVVRELKHFIRRHKGIIALDIPLLYEAKLENLVDKVVVVSVSKNQQIARLQRRNGLSRSEALQRIGAQMPLSIKTRRADTVIRNGGTRSQLRRLVERLYKGIKK